VPGPIVLEQHGEDWHAQCRLCAFRSDALRSCDVAADVAYDHVVAEHPEVEEP
jgi:hypothetical protein